MRKTIIVILYLVSPFAPLESVSTILHDIKFTVPDLVAKHGYPVERHHVTTDDGYILELHRIPRTPSDSPKGEPRPAVIVLHGLLCSSASWVVLGPKKALAYILAENGYDVWLMNYRGTTYSTNHTTLHTRSREFWNFSWHEMGYYDIPSTIDYILENFHPPYIDVIGFSMGTTSFFVAMSEKPEYNSKVRKMVGMAPSAYGQDSRGLLREMAPYTNLLQRTALKHNILEFPPLSLHINEFLHSVCDPKNYLQWLCYMTFWSFERSNIYGLRRDLFPLVFHFFPNTASIRTITHYHQVYMTDEFVKYNYGREENLKRYGIHPPPKYNLSHVTAHQYLFWSKEDAIVAPNGVKRLMKYFPKYSKSIEITAINFSHSSYKWGIDIHKVLYPKILNILKA